MKKPKKAVVRAWVLKRKDKQLDIVYVFTSKQAADNHIWFWETKNAIPVQVEIKEL